MCLFSNVYHLLMATLANTVLKERIVFFQVSGYIPLIGGLFLLFRVHQILNLIQMFEFRLKWNNFTLLCEM